MLDTKQHYGGVTRFFHWFIFLLITGQLLLGLFMGDVSDRAWRMNAYTIHKSTGLVILAVAVLFILWRWFNRRPSWPATMPQWEQVAAHSVHVTLYWCLVVLPLTGWVMSTAAGYPPNFFWLHKISLPLVPKNHALSKTAALLHVIFAWMITVFAVVHVLAALKHFFIDRDGILQRMLRGKPS